MNVFYSRRKRFHMQSEDTFLQEDVQKWKNKYLKAKQDKDTAEEIVRTQGKLIESLLEKHEDLKMQLSEEKRKMEERMRAEKSERSQLEFCLEEMQAQAIELQQVRAKAKLWQMACDDISEDIHLEY